MFPKAVFPRRAADDSAMGEKFRASEEVHPKNNVTALSCDKLICQGVLLEFGGVALMEFKEHAPSF